MEATLAPLALSVKRGSQGHSVIHTVPRGLVRVHGAVFLVERRIFAAHSTTYLFKGLLYRASGERTPPSPALGDVTPHHIRTRTPGYQ